ncbi:MAG: hypothetical protein AAF434_11735 [Pseudomonadota bacterium]
MSDKKSQDPLGTIIQFHRRVCALLVVASFAAYGVAYYVWTLGQSVGAVVIATMGYLFFRSLRKIAFNMTWQHFSDKPEYNTLVQQLDSTTLAKREYTIREHLAERQNEAKNPESE